ncbi:MAG: AAA family ATPase, partial [Pseudomonadota bacterium]|nr:AAA family ATPase [Pseudomonadota bacterium]
MRLQIDPNKATKAVQENKSRLEQRIERLLLEMSNTVASIGADQWRDQLTLLLSHPKPPKGLEPFHEAMRAAIARPRRDEQFVDRVLEAVAASERYRRLDDYLEPIRLALLSFVSSVSIRPSVIMSAVGRLLKNSDAKLPLQMSCWTLEPRVQSRQSEKKNVRYAKVDVAGPVQRAVNVLLEERATGSGAFATWSYEDLLSGLKALWLAYTYCSVGTASSVCLNTTDLRNDFERCGTPLWKQLDTLIAKSSRMTGEWAGLNTRADFARLTLSVGTARDEDSWTAEDDEEQAPEPSLSGLTHVVCRGVIPASSEKYDKEEIQRHRLLEQPLALAAMPSTTSLLRSMDQLLGEFPWASAAIHIIFDDLLGRANLGVQDLTMPATLLIGLPGAGKSRLARRIAEELGLPRLDVSLSGTSDTKLLAGTSRGWASGRPSDLASLMVREETASALVMLDEIDKAHDGHREGGGISAYLLPLLEPETACRHYDSFLKTECDFSKVSWLCTANTLRGLSKPLQSRLRIVLVPQPRSEDLPSVCAAVIADLEQRWQVPTGTI